MDLDPQGTCHLVGCEGKGKHAPHGIGTPTPESYERQMNPNCLGFAKLTVTSVGAMAHCSIVAAAWSCRLSPGNVINLPALVDRHKRECPNRRPR